MKNNFSTSMKEIISFSRDEAVRLGNDFIGTEHLLLGLIRQENNNAVLILKKFHVDLSGLSSELESSIKNPNGKNGDGINELSLTNEAEGLVRSAVNEKTALNARTVEPEHFLIALLKDKTNGPARILYELGITETIFSSKLKDSDHNKDKNNNEQKSRTNAFWQIFIFEIKYRLKRPDTYLYFLVFFIITVLSFSTGSLPANDKTFVNAPIVLAKYFTIISIFLMVVTAAVMGAPLYRDIEYNTHEYYLSYPITKNDYFWGRFFGSFLFVLIIGSTLVWGALIGTAIGPALHWISPDRVGPNHFINYLHPFLWFLVPNLLFTSSIFFGLVSYTRNIKVIYGGAVILYLGYMMSLFIFHNSNNQKVAALLDAFAFGPIANISEGLFSPGEQNYSLVPVKGLLLTNRIIWTSVSLSIVLLTYFRFSFIRFFGGRKDKKNGDLAIAKKPGFLKKIPVVVTSFVADYNRKVMFALAKIEWLSITRDTYFRLILGVGIFFLGFIFWMGYRRPFDVSDFPRTVVLMGIFNGEFIFFVFLIILFYTGETIFRERTTRFAIINDALPPANWVFYGSKLIALFFLCVLLATVPAVVGICIQLAKGYTHLDFSTYLAACYGISLPLFIEMMMFAFVVHILVNNKFAGHAVAMIIWVLLLLGYATRRFDYRLFLYSYKPDCTFSEMDGVGPSVKSLVWFDIYWFFCGGLFVVVGALFYYRGVIASFKERKKLARHRFQGRIRWIAFILLTGFLLTGAYDYYNVSHINTYLTHKERIQRMVAFEKELKKYENDPLPTPIKLQILSDIFPEERKAILKAYATLVNKTGKPITRLLFDGDRLTSYSIKCDGKEVFYTSPLIYTRPKFSLFKPARDTSMYRLYQFAKPILPGDTVTIEINSSQENNGFTNGYAGLSILHNGTGFDGGLPELGYDEDEELNSNYERKEYGLSEKKERFIAQDDSVGRSRISYAEIPAGLMQFDATISTSGDQVAVAPGQLEKQWKQNGRNYYHYTLERTSYPSFPILSARYAIARDKVQMDNETPVNIELYYHPSDSANLKHFMSAYKDGLKYFSKVYGPYQFGQMRLIESSTYNRDMIAFPNSQANTERYAWNAWFKNPGQFDYVYFYAAMQLCKQWWMYQVAPNHTIGSNVISEGLSKYGAMLLYEKKAGADHIVNYLLGESDWYLFWHGRGYEKENPLLTAKRDWAWDTKAGMVLYGLKDLIGEDSMNSALREFHDAYAFRDNPPFPGSNDLYRFIKKHVPDSLQYYLVDSWEKITVYDNKILEATATATGKNDEYKVRLKISAGKTYADSAGNDVPASTMNDYIDIGIFAADTKTDNSRSKANPIYFKKHKFTKGEHVIEIVVKGKPVSAGIDPYARLIDRRRDDNAKSF